MCKVLNMVLEEVAESEELLYFVFITGRGHIANYLQLFTSRFDAILGLLEA